jgi:hypothetical protein
MLVVWPGNFAITEGPATVLCHYHDEKLWNIATMQIKGRLERRADGWVFVSSAFTPPSGLLLAFGGSPRVTRQQDSDTSINAASNHPGSTGTPSVNFAAKRTHGSNEEFE